MHRLVLILIILFFCACEEPIMHDLSEGEVNKLITILNDVNIVAERARQPDGKWSLEVAEKSKLKALKHIQDQRIFRTKRNVEKSKSAFVSSREQQRFKHERGLSAEIEQTLLSLEGVLECRVHLNLPRRDPIFGHTLDKENNGSGSVLLVAEEEFSANDESIAALVSGAAGIPKDFISVMVSKTVPLSKKVLELNEEPLVLSIDKVRKENYLKSISKTQILVSLLILLVGLAWIFIRKVNIKKTRLKNLQMKLETCNNI